MKINILDSNSNPKFMTIKHIQNCFLFREVLTTKHIQYYFLFKAVLTTFFISSSQTKQTITSTIAFSALSLQ